MSLLPWAVEGGRPSRSSAAPQLANMWSSAPGGRLHPGDGAAAAAGAMPLAVSSPDGGHFQKQPGGQKPQHLLMEPLNLRLQSRFTNGPANSQGGIIETESF